MPGSTSLPSELLGKDADHYEKVTDILDVWFDSGVTHGCVLEARPELQFPADLYLEGSDQHRGWFQSSLLSSVAIHGTAPYKAVLTHGFTVDAKGMKMSKSKGNTIAPQQVIKTQGADILRLWVAATDYRTEMNISDEILTRIADSYRRLRNTARYLLSNLAGFDPARDLLKPAEMLALDRWALNRARSLHQDIVAAYDSYSFHVIYQRLHQFCSVDLGGFYLDVLKDRVYTARADSRCAALRPDRHVPPAGSAGTLDGADSELHGRGDLAQHAGQPRRERVARNLVHAAGGPGTG